MLGASNGSIFYKLSGEFLQLVLISFVLASVAGYYAVGQWLADFEYSIRMDPGTFVLAGILSVLIALVTISFQALKAAFTNPAKSLRTD